MKTKTREKTSIGFRLTENNYKIYKKLYPKLIKRFDNINNYLNLLFEGYYKDDTRLRKQLIKEYEQKIKELKGRR